MRIRSLAGGAPLCALLAVAPAAAQAPRFEPQPCPARMEDARCGTVRVPENRDAPGRVLALNVVVLPARSAAPVRQAIAFFGGGPGQAVTQIAPWVAPMFAPLRHTHDLLFIDQRGTGGSGPLPCALRDEADPQSFLDDYLPAAAVARCRDDLSRTADLARYGTVELAHDVESDLEGPARFSCQVTRPQLRTLAETIVPLLAAGRPRCPACEAPLGTGKHICPRANGHAARAAED